MLCGLVHCVVRSFTNPVQEGKTCYEAANKACRECLRWSQNSFRRFGVL